MRTVKVSIHRCKQLQPHQGMRMIICISSGFEYLYILTRYLTASVNKSHQKIEWIYHNRMSFAINVSQSAAAQCWYYAMLARSSTSHPLCRPCVLIWDRGYNIELLE